MFMYIVTKIVIEFFLLTKYTGSKKNFKLRIIQPENIKKNVHNKY